MNERPAGRTPPEADRASSDHPLSQLREEALGIADAVDRALDAALPRTVPGPPGPVYTLARGSSLHAATVVHRFMGSAGVPASTMALGLVQPALRLQGATLLAISQSGASPDLCSAVSTCVVGNATVIALVNLPDSRLESLASVTVHQRAGSEVAVAATKSVICSIVAGARLAEHWGAPPFGLDTLAADIRTVQGDGWSTELVAFLARNGPLLVIGRGTGHGIACEIALKCQELLGRAAAAYSSAEVLHGPAGVVSEGFAVLAIAVGPERESVRECAARLVTFGADVLLLDEAPRTDDLASTVVLAGLYPALEAAARALGRSPDSPPNLSKVTLTE